jgi:hypothetical protein
MKDEYEALISFKLRKFPPAIQQYIHEVIKQIINGKYQDLISVDSIKIMLSLVEFSFEGGEDGRYVIVIRYSPFPNSHYSLPMWRIAWTEKEDNKEVKRIDEIMAWIFEFHWQGAMNGVRPRYYSRCQEKQVVFTELNGQTISIPVRDIIYLSAEGDFTRVFHGHKKELKTNLVDLSMRGAERLMNPFCFYRIHRSYMVNLGCIRNIHTINSLVSVVLCSGDVLPIARRRKTALIESFNTFEISI